MVRDKDKIIGRHGSNIYFKEFTVPSTSELKTYRLGSFYFVRKSPEYPITIAEFQLIWLNTKDGKKYASARLYFNPKEADHDEISDFGELGEDEVIEADKHVVIECSKISSWECSASLWYENLGKVAYHGISKECIQNIYQLPKCHTFNQDVQSVKILSYPQYCRYKTCLCMLKKGHKFFSSQSLFAIGGLELENLKTTVLFSRWRFNKSDIMEFSLTKGIQAPVFKGRPRKNKIPLILPSQLKTFPRKYTRKIFQKSYSHLNEPTNKSHTTQQSDTLPEVCRPNSPSLPTQKEESKAVYDKHEEKTKALNFSKNVMTFMKDRDTAIAKIPSIGYKQVNLYQLFVLVAAYGGYEQVTLKKQWRNIYNHLGHSSTITNAATITRKAYETLLLPYEKHSQKTPPQIDSQTTIVETKKSDESEEYVDVIGENEDEDVDDIAPLKPLSAPSNDNSEISPEPTTMCTEEDERSRDSNKTVKIMIEKRRGRPSNEFRNKIEHLKVTNERVEVEFYPALTKYSRVPAWLNELNVDIVNPQRKRKRSSPDDEQNVSQFDKIPVATNSTEQEKGRAKDGRQEISYEIPFVKTSDSSTANNNRNDYCVIQKPSLSNNNVSLAPDNHSFCEFQIKSVRSLAPNHSPLKEKPMSIIHYPRKKNNTFNDIGSSVKHLPHHEMSNPHQYLTEDSFFNTSSHYPVNGSFRSGHFSAHTFGRETEQPSRILHYANNVISQRTMSEASRSGEMHHLNDFDQRHELRNHDGRDEYVIDRRKQPNHRLAQASGYINHI